MVIDDLNAVGMLAQQVLDALARPLTGGEREVHLSVSIGVAVYPEGGGDTAMSVNHAEAAMHHAKENERNRTTRYSRVLEIQMLRCLTLNEHTRHVLVHGQMRLVYQPKYTFDSGGLVAVEALMQRSDPEPGAMLPSELIDVVEESDYILKPDRWALMQACT